MFFLPSSGGQTPPPHYQLIFHNRYVEVFKIELAPGRQAPIHDNIYDLVWIPLDNGILEVQQGNGERKQMQLDAGDVRFFRSHEVNSLMNNTHGPVHGVVVEIRRRGASRGNCGCTADVESAICGCGRSPVLPPYWALAIGEVTLAGTTLQSGQSFEAANNRDDTLLIAISRIQLRHEVNLGNQCESVPSPPTTLERLPGGLEWLPQGRHHLTNVGDKPARFISIEF